MWLIRVWSKNRSDAFHNQIPNDNSVVFRLFRKGRQICIGRTKKLFQNAPLDVMYTQIFGFVFANKNL